MDGQNENINNEMVQADTKPKQKLSEWLKNSDKYQGKEYADEDAAVADAIAYIDELKATSKEAEAAKENIKQAIEETPLFAFLLKDAKETGSVQVSFQSLFDNPEDMILRDGDDGYEMVQERLNKRLEQEKMNSEIAQNWEQKQGELADNIDAFAQEKGIDDTAKEDFVGFIGKFMTKLVTGDMNILRWIKTGREILLAIAVIALFVICGGQKKHIATLKFNNEKQAATIDSLLNRRMTVFDVKLNVTDKSTNKVNGKYNKGSIFVPTEKIYKLEFDSVSFNLK